MEKRLNRTDLGFSLVFLLMLIIAAGAFFYGVKVGTDRTRAEIQAAQPPGKTKADAAPSAYEQQDLVSFYHTVFLPYREFQNAWFDTKEKWESDPSVDLSVSLKELGKTADAKYAKIRTAFVAHSSPLLQDAQSDYLKSLKLFSESFAGLSPKANEGTAAKLQQTLESQAFFQNARKFGLSAQNAYYTSMLKWSASVNTEINGDYKTPAAVDLAAWKQMPLIIKNKAVADYLSGNSLFTEYPPHDLTARIDQFIQSGKAGKMKLKTVGEIADLLTGTDAVRSGDFLKNKSVLYGNEQLPLLPFFIPDK